MERIKKATPNTSQTSLDFEAVKWPEHTSFPLNKKVGNATVEDVIYTDIETSTNYLIITGFTSLSNLVDYFGSNEFAKLKTIRILIGFEPNIRGRRKYQTVKLDKEIKEYWLKKGLSIMSGGAVMKLIQKIDTGLIIFRYRDKQHAKLYVGDDFVVLGSSNFSKTGLTIQEEANIRVGRINEHEYTQYNSIKKIAENYFEEAHEYNDKIKELLKELIQHTDWEEALARAIAELLDGEWLAEYREILDKLKSSNLWPTQWKGLAQAVSILQSQYNVLLADPTGAGKTKLSTSLILALKHWLYQVGKNYSTSSLVICPPLVVSKWEEEFRSLKKLNSSQLSMGLLSNAGGPNKKKVKESLEIAKILTVDEAHNYLSENSNRTRLIKGNRAEYKILVTATPISKKVEDLLRLIDLLDLDNLSDGDFKSYEDLIRNPQLRNQEQHIRKLRKFISQFMVRRTKKSLNAEIDKEPEMYKNKLNKTCKFPSQVERTYDTEETSGDLEIVMEISNLVSRLQGVTYLTTFHKPSFEMTNEESIRGYIDKRLSAAKALSIYIIRSALRSSHVALVEHIEGTEEAMRIFKFKGKTTSTGNKIKILQDLIATGKLPSRNKLFKDEYFPSWLINNKEYIDACSSDLKIYEDVSKLAKRLSGKRELGKVKQLEQIARKHKFILAFDSTVITLHYLRHLFSNQYPKQNVLVASGSDSDKESRKVMDTFNITSGSNVKTIALCSDKMSESIDLQRASCVMLLDMPSVLRIVEQRIGRADRMDSVHEAIDIYWPKDSEEFSLKADRRLVQTNAWVDQIYGSNFNVPEELRERHFENVENISSIIQEYKDFIDKDESWKGLTDSFQPIIELKEGDNPLIRKETYEAYKGVQASVRTRVSFVGNDKNWCFIALRGEKNRSPKWYFIDDEDTIHTEFSDVCAQLRIHLTKKSKGLEWNDAALKRYIVYFKVKERALLPPKKKRALDVAKYILERSLRRREINIVTKRIIQSHLELLKPHNQFAIDYEWLADEWISILQPYLNEKRDNLRRKRTVINLSSLKSEYKKIDFSADIFAAILENAPTTDDIDSKIASCIIGIAERKKGSVN
ncbi:SNF2-related protein [Flavitalea sp. BT771]|uniref:SNF2-related protein n=1 Tax=Flavitalea sp. BT771 TaxID=3063329 RepID=UPI0026E4057E|nr:SNF2-related protein [Flavitalea sp. BT771]MDO6433020.1 SNF2-related protein [Flavitalea sp. BT771]MDV6221704.1 SNF2-related protein [Flavitalea sp. BT771]